jgi:hypothetical protein
MQYALYRYKGAEIEGRELAGLIGTRGQHQQWTCIAETAGAALAVELLTAPFCAAVLPFG